MIGTAIVNILDMLDCGKDDILKIICDEFECPLNKEHRDIMFWIYAGYVYRIIVMSNPIKYCVCQRSSIASELVIPL